PHIDQFFAGQPIQGFAYNCAADGKDIAEAVFRQLCFRRQTLFENGIRYGAVDALVGVPIHSGRRLFVKQGVPWFAVAGHCFSSFVRTHYIRSAWCWRHELSTEKIIIILDTFFHALSIRLASRYWHSSRIQQHQSSGSSGNRPPMRAVTSSAAARTTGP